MTGRFMVANRQCQEDTDSVNGNVVEKSRNPEPIIATCLIGLVLVGQLLAPWTDHQMTNIASIAMGVAAVVMLNIWWFKVFSTRPEVRWIPCVVFVIGLLTFYTKYRYDGVSGELLPAFVPRENPRSTPLPTPSQHAAPVDREASAVEKYAGFWGQQRDGIVARREFGRNWENTPPKLKFRQPIGAGWSGLAVSGTLVYTLEQREDQEWVSCYQISNGDLVWRHAESVRHESTLGGIGPRSTPQVADDVVFSHGATGIVLCLDRFSGKMRWRVDLLQLQGVDQSELEQAVPWGRSGSPLYLDDVVVLPFGGPSEEIAALIALDKATGIERWRTASGAGQQISYASPILREIDGIRQIISVNESNVSAYSPKDGERLWEMDWPGASNGGANCSQPVFVSNNDCLISKGYGGGCMLFRIRRSEMGFELEKQWQIRSLLKTKFTSAIFKDGFVFGLSDGILECIDAGQGIRVWRQPRRNRYRHGQVLLVEDTLLVSAEDGRVALVEANPESFIEVASFQAIEGKTWNIPTIAGSTLLVRNGKEFASYQLPKRIHDK